MQRALTGRYIHSGNYNNIKAISQVEDEPVVGLLTADDNRNSYYLDEELNEYIYCHDFFKEEKLGISFVSTDVRVEYIEDIDDKISEFETDVWNNQLGILEVFTHEWALSAENKEKVEKICKWVKENDYENMFLEDLFSVSMT